ncbi:DUF927 domain-containing protein [Neorhizobium sp. T25_13]|uniref:DUF927 domain-containing protein n=1 Tax=Neorhizobium sp. T25_13 TaxID=2093830 RepID=UPI000CF8D5CB|nr:DUF927 domain-containing protein [Neorhizobium sp. T25_13]
MKDAVTRHFEGLQRYARRVKGGGGKKGLPTAPSSTAKSSRPSEKAGLGPVSGQATKAAAREAKAVPTKKSGLGPVFDDGESPSRPSIGDLVVECMDGDDGLLYYLFAAKGGKFVLPLTELAATPQKVLVELAKIRVRVNGRAARDQLNAKIEAAGSNKSTVATIQGYERVTRPRYFVYGDGHVILGERRLVVHPRTTGSQAFERAGELEAYETGVAPVLRDQAIPLTVFFFGLSQVIKPFAKAAGINAENMMMDLVGRSTNYKTALTSTVAGSIWGKPDRVGGYAHRWNMSAQKIEEFFREHDNHLLILDEATLADKDPKKRGDVILNVVHRLSSGESRARTGEAITAHSLSMLSNSNEPMRTILAASEDVTEALEARLISFKLPTRETGFFDSVPEGFSSLGAAMKQIFTVTQANHGLLARKLILEVLRYVHRDHAGLLEVIKGAVGKFMKAAGQGEAEMATLPYRRVQSFALAYATAVIAFKTKTLHKKQWGRVKRTLLRAWNEHANALESDGDLRFNEYMTDPSHVFADARGSEKPEVSDKAFKKIDGIVFTAKDKTLCLAVPLHAIGKLNYSTAKLKQLKKDGILRAGGNLQSKLRLRRVGREERRDVFYVFRVTAINSQTRFNE